MKAKLESINPIFQKEKKIVIEFNQKFGGTIVINVEAFFDNHGTMETELYVNSIINKLPYNIDVYTSSDSNNKVTVELDLLNLEHNSKSKEMINQINTVIKSLNTI